LYNELFTDIIGGLPLAGKDEIAIQDTESDYRFSGNELCK